MRQHGLEGLDQAGDGRLCSSGWLGVDELQQGVERAHDLVQEIKQAWRWGDFPAFQGSKDAFQGLAQGFDVRHVDRARRAFEAVRRTKGRLENADARLRGRSLLQLDQARSDHLDMLLRFDCERRQQAL